MHPWIVILLLLLPLAAVGDMLVGVGRVDITPNEPIRLSGYGGRRIEATNISQKLWAKGLGLGEKGKASVLFLTVDNCGVPASMVDEVHKEISEHIRLPRENFILTFTHTHSGPCLSSILPNLFSEDVPADHQARIDRYSMELKKQLVSLSLETLRNLKRGKIEWGQGIARFAKNRRTENGPVDHTLGIFRASSTEGKVLGVMANYACHCTTLGGEFNEVHGDWAGFAQEYIERDHPGALGMVMIGCGADANPHPRGKLEHASSHGEEIAREIRRVKQLTELTNLPVCKRIELNLPFEPLPSRTEWETRARQPGIVGYHAKRNLARLDRGEKLPTHLPYSVQSADFGGNLQMIFLPGEVVVDYSLRLARELNRELWVTAYANDAPCYIPSRRILKEGGYEAESSLWYYDKPARLAPETEDLIIKAVHELVPQSYRTERADFPLPKNPEGALRTFRVKGDFQISLAAAEPLVVDPVAIDFGGDGRLWVVEMHDYPTGIDGKGKPGGRVKVLTDNNEDGVFDEAKVFMDGLAFPTGLLLWSNGVFICAAPDIIFAQDRNGDGRADYTNAVFRGFATHNFQARVNSLKFGLDGWIYGACGLFGGEITTPNGKVPLNSTDFRFKPGTWEFEPVSGQSQQGRVRDDYGNWFGSDNSTWLWHFPLANRPLSELNISGFPNRRVSVASGPNANRVYPTSRTLARFNDPQMENQVTSGCGIDIFRDRTFGDEYYGNAFACEPVHNLVHRLILKPNGVTYSASRSTEDANDEFLTSTDNWFRPVQARLGPDGALWVVDMYRFVVEHPIWIPQDRLKELDVRAGSDKGRIYRIHKPGAVWPKVLTQEQAAKAIQSSNGVLRDMAQQILINPQSATHPDPAVFTQLLWTGRDPKLLDIAASHANPKVRIQYARLSHNVANLINDTDLAVRFEAVLALSRQQSEQAGSLLAGLLKDTNLWIRAAVLNGSKIHGLRFAKELLKGDKAPDKLFFSILEQIPPSPDLLDLLVSKRPLQRWQLMALTKFEDNLPSNIIEEIKQFRDTAPGSPETFMWIGKLGQPQTEAAEILLKSAREPELRTAALKQIGTFDGLDVIDAIIKKWDSVSPNLRGDLLKVLAARKSWARPLLQAVQGGIISRSEFPLDVRQSLLQSKEPLAELVFRSNTGDKINLVQKYSSHISGDRTAGEQVFQENCASCHRYAGQGNSVGPDIAIYRGKTIEDLALAVFAPNSAIEPRFVNYNLELADGRSLSGLLASDAQDKVELLQSGGQKQSAVRSEIISMKASDISMMPEGFEQILTPEKFANLYAFIKEGGPKAFGSATSKEAEEALAKFKASESTTKVTLISAAEQLPYPSWLGRLPMAHCRQTSGSSSVRWKSKGLRKDNKIVFQFPIGVGHLSQPSAGFRLLVNQKPISKFDVMLDSAGWESSDGKHTFNYRVIENNREDSNGVLEITLDPQQFPAGEDLIFEVVGNPGKSQRWFGLYLY